MKKHAGAVAHLFMKGRGEQTPRAVDKHAFSPAGIRGAKDYSPLRQVLLTAESDLAEIGYRPGELHENILLSCPYLQQMASGTVLAIGEARIQLTFHCEPCFRIQKYESLKPLLHRRGVLGKFLNTGEIRLGDPVAVLDRREEEIPYASRERIAWFLRKHGEPITAAKLLHEVGLARGYARALPAILRKIPPEHASLVVFGSRK